MWVTKNIHEANAVTHGGTMHADEVFATVILDRAIPNLTVYRAAQPPANLAPNVIVYDIGGGKYDHHQPDGNGRRANGVPYASAGLIWKEFGPAICAEAADPGAVWASVDKCLIQGIDAEDNGEFPGYDYPARPASVNQVISGFNPVWDSDETSDDAFIQAFKFAKVIFDHSFAVANAKARGKVCVENSLKEAKDGLLILDSYVPWENSLFWPSPWLREAAASIQFVIYPSQRGGYNWYSVRVAPRTKKFKTLAPASWCGLREEELQKASAVKTAIFCHAAGFIGGAETLEDTILMAKLAIAEQESRQPDNLGKTGT